MTLNSIASQMNNVTGENNFAASLKNGYHQLIHSMNAELGNNSVVSTSSYTNMAINYQLLTGMCQCNISLPDTGSCYSIRISKL